MPTPDKALAVSLNFLRPGQRRFAADNRLHLASTSDNGESLRTRARLLILRELGNVS